MSRANLAKLCLAAVSSIADEQGALSGALSKIVNFRAALAVRSASIAVCAVYRMRPGHLVYQST